MEYDNLKYIRNVLQKEIDAGGINGAAVRVIHKKAQVYEEELGYADKENNKLITKNTIFRLYSMTKPITSVAIMILFERGELNLLTPVSRYLEGFNNQKVQTLDGLKDVPREITIQDLLNMTSGIVYPDEEFKVGRIMGELYNKVDRMYTEGNQVNTVDFCNMIGKVPLEFNPGERWRYGASADVLGAIIEVVTGIKFGEFLRREIFEPLGMIDTDFYVPKEKQERFASTYEYNEETNKLVKFTDRFLQIGDCLEPPAFESGGAGLVSTVEDYSRFAIMLANKGSYCNKRILGRKTVEYMSTPQLSKTQVASFDWDTIIGYSYGNLFRSFVDPIKAATNGSIGEFGWDGWTGNYFFVDPKEDIILIYMIQRCNGVNPDIIKRLRQVVYGAI